MFKTIFKKKIKVTVNRQSVLLQNKFYSYFLNAQTDVVYCSTIKSKNKLPVYEFFFSFSHIQCTCILLLCYFEVGFSFKKSSFLSLSKKKTNKMLTNRVN